MLDTFDNNKAFTSKDPITNQLIVQSLNIKLNSFIAAPDARSISSSPVQVLGLDAINPNVGAEAVVREMANDATMDNNITSTLRRSSRLANEGIT